MEFLPFLLNGSIPKREDLAVDLVYSFTHVLVILQPKHQLFPRSLQFQRDFDGKLRPCHW